jgi:hypothetical protein
MLQAFLFPHTQGEVVLYPPSPAGVFTYSTRGKCPFPPLLWSFPPTVTFTSFPAPGCWVGATTPAFSLWLVYLQFRDGFPLPHLLCSGRLAFFATWLFYCCCLLFSLIFFPFSPGWGSVCRGSYADLAQGCLWEYHMPLSSRCALHHPNQSGSWRLAARELSWFLHLTWSEDAMRKLGCGAVKVLPLIGGFSCKVYLQYLSKLLL